MRSVKFGLAVILLVSFLVRIYGIDFGLPQVYQIDEAKIFYTVLYTGANSLRPDTFIHSTLVAYFLLPFYGAFYLLGRVLGWFASPLWFYVEFLKDPTPFLLLGRLVMVVVGTAVVFQMWLVGKRFSPRVGMLAAVFTGLNLLSVKEAHYIKDETLATGFLLGYLVFLLRAQARRSSRDLSLAAVGFGLTVATKYLYAPVGLAVLALGRRRPPWKRFTAFFLTAALVYAVTNPYVMLEFRRFWRETWGVLVSREALGPLQDPDRSRLVTIATETLPQEMGWPVYLLAGAGLVVCLLGKAGRGGWLVAWFSLAVVGSIVVAGGGFARWLVPAVPLLALLGAIALEKARLRASVLILVALIVLSPNFLRVLRFDHLLTFPDTRTIAKTWIEANIAQGSSLAVEGTGRDVIASYLGPPLRLTREQILGELSRVQAAGQEGISLRAQLEAFGEEVGYKVIGAPRLTLVYDAERDGYVPIADASHYAEKGTQYLVRSSWASGESNGEWLASLDRYYEEVKRFAPTLAFPSDPHAWAMDYVVLDRVSLLRKGVFGPTITIHRLRGEREK